jgi:hypothetical protein
MEKKIACVVLNFPAAYKDSITFFFCRVFFAKSRVYDAVVYFSEDHSIKCKCTVRFHTKNREHCLGCYTEILVDCRGFVNRSAIGVGVWRFVEGSERGGAIRDGGSTSLPSFKSRNGGETLRAAINHYMATSARLQ